MGPNLSLQRPLRDTIYLLSQTIKPINTEIRNPRNGSHVVDRLRGFRGLCMYFLIVSSHGGSYLRRIREDLQSDHNLESRHQKTRSLFRRIGRLILHC